ncbi:MAG: DUF4124 domain-containing protein [Rhodocyclaceae bacterium]|nr:DUF4124 domain-containing protein [Rhodocyclaceae bacterium]
MRVAIVAFALGLVSAGSLAQVYSWKDANGQTHYSDQPPREKPESARKLETKQTPHTDVEAQRKTQADKDLDSRKKQKQDQEIASKQEKSKQDAEERRKGCAKAQAYVKAIESGQINSTISDDGKTVPLNKEGLATELADARKSADSWCKDEK